MGNTRTGTAGRRRPPPIHKGRGRRGGLGCAPAAASSHSAAGFRLWLRAIDADPAAVPHILASAARVRNQDSMEGHFSFTSECPLGVRVCSALRVATKPTRVRIDGQAVDRYEFDERVGVLWLQHDGKPSGTVVQLDY